MKYSLLALLLFSVGISFSQNLKFEYYGRWNPAVKKEKLDNAKYINDVTENFWNKFMVYKGDQKEFERQRTLSYSQKYFYNCAGSRFNHDIIFVSTELITNVDGKRIHTASAGDELTNEQKNVLSALKIGEDIEIIIKFKYKYSDGNLESLDKVNEGKMELSLVPEKEAEFKGGGTQFNNYMNENLEKGIKTKNDRRWIMQTEVMFCINEQGKVENVRLSRATGDKRLDKIVVEVLNKMPDWIPAQDKKGKKIKQEFRIPFGGWGGC